MSHVHQNGSDVSHAHSGCSTYESSTSVIALNLKVKKYGPEIHMFILKHMFHSCNPTAGRSYDIWDFLA